MASPKELLQTMTRNALKGLATALGDFFGALGHVPGQIESGFKEAAAGLRSPDRPTRRMSVVFYLSVLGVVITVLGFGKFVMDSRERARLVRVEEERRVAEEKAKEEEERRLREPPPYQSIGTFSLELREPDGVTRTAGLRAAEMEIVVACSEIDTCEWLKANTDRARGELSALFTPTDREKIMSMGGKKAFREEIRDALNRLLEERKVKGTILEVLFPRFIVS